MTLLTKYPKHLANWNDISTDLKKQISPLDEIQFTITKN